MTPLVSTRRMCRGSWRNLCLKRNERSQAKISAIKAKLSLSCALWQGYGGASWAILWLTGFLSRMKFESLRWDLAQWRKLLSLDSETNFWTPVWVLIGLKCSSSTYCYSSGAVSAMASLIYSPSLTICRPSVSLNLKSPTTRSYDSQHSRTGSLIPRSKRSALNLGTNFVDCVGCWTLTQRADLLHESSKALRRRQPGTARAGLPVVSSIPVLGPVINAVLNPIVLMIIYLAGGMPTKFALLLFAECWNRGNICRHWMQSLTVAVEISSLVMSGSSYEWFQ